MRSPPDCLGHRREDLNGSWGLEAMGRQASQLDDGCSLPITLCGNPKAAGVRKGFHDPYSNDGHYERLAGDGLSDWHPAFLQLAPTLEGCAKRYTQYCLSYRPRAKPARKPGWGSRLLQRDGGSGGDVQAG